MDPSLVSLHLDRLDKKAVRKIITASFSRHELPVSIRQTPSGANSNKYKGKAKAPR